MVALALDIGETRIGIAASSRDGKMAMPVKVLPAAEVTGMAKTFRYLVEDYEPDILVSGRPLTMAGEPGPQAERVAAVAQKIADELDLPLEFEDERLSSQEAKRILREQGLNEKQMRGKIDMIAASLFLQPAPRPAQPGQRPAQPTQRAAQPAAPPAQSFSHSAQPVQRTGQQPSARSVQHSASHAAQQPTARTAQPAGGTRFKQQAPTQRTQAPQSHSHHARGSHGVAPATRSSYNTHARRGAQKKSSPVPMIIGVVVAVLAFAAIAFFVVPAVKGFFAGEDTKVTAGQQVTVTIPDGASGDTIASILSENHIVENPKDYYAAVKKLNADMSLKPGDYSFTTLMDATKVVQQLMEGPNAGSNALTIPEGLTVDQVADRVAQAYDSISKEDFLNQAKASNYVDDYSFLKGAANDSLEGFLFPKTYSLGDSPTADDVIRAMLDQFKTEYKSLDFASCEDKIKERYGVEMSDYDIVNLASIVEREGLNADQRAHVASVFYNRLAGKLDGLRYLNSDATMMYVTGGEVTADDLQSDSPYNTYKHEGLPPTPICSPSLEALKATLEPTDSDDLYFYITQDEEYFSQTYEEHQQSWN